MPPVVRSRLQVLAVGLVLVAGPVGVAGCGAEIGDSCIILQDCNPQGEQDLRFCDTSQTHGYCTIQGCDFDTCPEEAVCIRFFTGSFANRPCDPATEDIATDMCAVDELCALDAHCVPRSSEVRYCMRKCGDQGDCRAEYECRDLDLMRSHGGEPVLAPGATLADPGLDVPSFCGMAP